MADQKLSDLPATTSPATTDILYIVTDPAGTPADKKVSVGDLRGASALTQIAAGTLGADAATISLTSIPGTYNHLRLFVVGRATGAVTDDFINMRFNNDSGANYDRLQSGVAANAVTAAWLGYLPGASAARANAAGFLRCEIPLYAGTTYEKVAEAFNGHMDTAGARMIVASTAWRNTAAITRIDLTVNGGSNFKAGTSYYLYGVS